MALLTTAVARLAERRFPTVFDSGWFDWDLGVSCPAGFLLKIATAQEDHGGGRRLIRVRYTLTLAPARGIVALRLGGLVLLAATAAGSLVLTRSVVVARVVLAALLWCRAGRQASRIVALVEAEAAALGMVPCAAGSRQKKSITARGGS